MTNPATTRSSNEVLVANLRRIRGELDRQIVLAETSPCIIPWSYSMETGRVSFQTAFRCSSGASIDLCAVYPIAHAAVTREDAS